MLSVKIHSSLLADRTPANTLAMLDIAYKVQQAWSDYTVHFALKGVGEVKSDEVLKYPRWAASVWDLVARALTVVLYRAEALPASAPPDRRCAYATKLCAVVERSTAADNHVELASMEITREDNKRGHYMVTFKEDVLGERKASFVFGVKSLQHSELVLRAICYAYFDNGTLGARPALILPTTLNVDGKQMFDVNALPEPARTGFNRYRSWKAPAEVSLPPMASADEYAMFLSKG